MPNAFAGTDLHTLVTAMGRKELLLAGLHDACARFSSTARAVLDHGYRITVVAPSCAARDLPDGLGGVVPAATVHMVALDCPIASP